MLVKYALTIDLLFAYSYSLFLPMDVTFGEQKANRKPYDRDFEISKLLTNYALN